MIHGASLKKWMFMGTLLSKRCIWRVYQAAEKISLLDKSQDFHGHGLRLKL